MGRQVDGPAGTPGRRDRAARDGGAAIFADDTPVGMLAPGTGKTRTARLGPTPRRAPVGQRDASRSLVSLLRRPQGRAPQGSPRRLPGLDACRRLCRLRGTLPHRRHPRGRLHGAQPPQVRRRSQSAGLGHRRRGHPPDRPALCRRERGPGLTAGPAHRDRQASAVQVFDDLESWLAAQLPTVSGGLSPELPRRNRGGHLLPEARLRFGPLHLARAHPLQRLRLVLGLCLQPPRDPEDRPEHHRAAAAHAAPALAPWGPLRRLLQKQR